MRRTVFLLPFLAFPALAAVCDPGIKPLQTGWVWTYRDTDKDGVELYDMKRSLTNDGYTDTYTTPGKPPLRQTYRCEDGAHVNITPPSIGGAEISRLMVTGVSFPTLPYWKTGAAWTYVMNLEGRKSGFNARATITFHYRILGREKVTVPAGTFEAWKVDVTGNVDAHVSILPIRQSFAETQWIGENLGIIKIKRVNGSTSELAALKK